MQASIPVEEAGRRFSVITSGATPAGDCLPITVRPPTGKENELYSAGAALAGTAYLFLRLRICPPFHTTVVSAPFTFQVSARLYGCGRCSFRSAVLPWTLGEHGRWQPASAHGKSLESSYALTLKSLKYRISRISGTSFSATVPLLKTAHLYPLNSLWLLSSTSQACATT